MPAIDVFLQMIQVQVDKYIRSTGSDNSTEDLVVFGNIATARAAGGENNSLSEKVVISIVNISEESTMKNTAMANGPKNSQNLVYHHPVYLNIYLLFVATFDTYLTANHHIFRIIEFFQGNQIFQLKSVPISETAEDEWHKIQNLELVMELHTLNFEQLNDLWGSLGGKQLPFVMYRARLIPVYGDQALSRSGVIHEVEMESHHLNNQ